MPDCVVVINDCATPSRPNIRNVRTRSTSYGEKNFTLGFERLAAGLPSPLTDRQLDWLEIVGALFAIDIACLRGEGDLTWSRRIEAHIPVREPTYWEAHRISFQDLFERLTFDSLSLHFEVDETPNSPPRQRREPFDEVSCVALLSGGLDSFVGGVDLAQAASEVPFFLSHPAGGAVRAAQARLKPVLQRSTPDAEFVAVSAQPRKLGSTEGSQRSRTLFFVGCALVVADALGLSTVYLNENGVMAVHLPMGAARLGSLSTRTASPAFLDRVGDLASLALGSSLRVSNRLVTLTKPDVVGLAVDLQTAGALKATVSCWSIGHTAHHCGYCAPCMMRRISCECHGVPDVAYVNDIFDDPAVINNRPAAKDNLAHFIETVGAVATESDEELELNYPELVNTGREISAAQARELHRRWASQALSVLQSHPVSAGLL